MTPDQIDRAAVAIRELNKQEADLLNHRMGWLVQSQSLLFAALAFTWEKSAALAYVLSGLGIAVAISIGLTTTLVSTAARNLVRWWELNVPADERATRIVIALDNPSRGMRRLLRPWRALPVIFGIAWVSVILIKALQ